MKNDYLTLDDGRKVRIRWNMNALGRFTKLTGKEITDLTNGKTDIDTMRTIAFCSDIEGERIEKREFELDEMDFGALMSMKNIVEFSQFFVSQTTGGSVAQKKPKALTKLTTAQKT